MTGEGIVGKSRGWFFVHGTTLNSIIWCLSFEGVPEGNGSLTWNSTAAEYAWVGHK